MGTPTPQPDSAESPHNRPDQQDLRTILPQLSENSIIQNLLNHAIESGTINTTITVYKKKGPPKNILAATLRSARQKPDNLIHKIMRAQTRAFIHTAQPTGQKTKHPASIAGRLLGLREDT